jgi:hypothetical protein
MKTHRWTYVIAVMISTYLSAKAQEPSPLNLGYTLQPLGPGQTRWSKVTGQTNDQGEVTYLTNSFIQLGNGLNRWQSNHWTQAIPELIATNGAVLARGAQATAFFSSNLNSQAAARIRLPDGQWLKLHLLGLAYHDTASGTNLLLAAPKNCAPQIVGTNRVAYVDALDDLRCDLVFSFTPAGIRQDLILRERPDAPDAYGLSNASTHLLLISEVDEGRAPQISERALPAGTEVLRDQILDFGTMQMIPGRAFRLQRADRRHDVFVSKQYETIGTRHFIVERVRYGRVRPELLSLPLTGGLATNTPGSFTNGGIQRVTRWYADDDPPRINSKQTAWLGGPAKPLALFEQKRGFVWDWDLVISGSDVTFSCGTTYEISGEVHLLGNTVLGPGAILKFDDNASLYIDGWLTCRDWDDSCWDRPVLLTSVFDNAADAGEVIQSGHPPVNGSCGPALCVSPSFLDSALNHCQVRYADPGIISNNRSLVTVAAADRNATKGSITDTASFTVTRVDGDWSGNLYVSFHLSGTARLGIDYTLAFYPNIEGDQVGTVVLPPGMDSAVVCVVPSGTGNSLAYASTAALIVDDASGSPYLVGSPSSATVAIIDPTLPAPPMLLNVDFVTQNYNPSSYKAGSAAIGQSAADFWNSLSCPGQYSTTLANLKTALFEATSVNLIVNNTPGTWGLGSPDPMYDLYMYPTYGQNGTLTLTGLTPGKYDLYLYGYDGNYSVTVGGTSYGNHQNRDWPLLTPLVWTEGKQYSRFGNISVGSGQSLVITLRPGTDGYAVISGLQLQFIPDPPLVVTSPANQTVMEGSTATFTVVASGFAPLSYQWTLNDADIAGATASTYTTEGVDMSANGRVYAVRVTNPGGTVASAGATLTVLQCDPATEAVRFISTLANDHVKTTFNGSFQILTGNPSEMAILVDDDNFADAVWTSYQPTFSGALPGADGAYNIWIGLRANSACEQTWEGTTVFRDTTLPVTVITNPVNATISRPYIQLQGYSTEPLRSVTYDLVNSSGTFSDQVGYTVGEYFDSTTKTFTTNWFQCFDLALATGANTVTIRATDLAGNTTTVVKTYTFDVSGDNEAPAITVDWPPTGAQAAVDKINIRGRLDDETAQLTALVQHGDGTTATIAGLVERNGHFWAEAVPLSPGLNTIVITATDAANNSSTAQITISRSPVNLSIADIDPSSVNQPTLSVNGTVSDPTYGVWVNGIQGGVDGSGNWVASGVPSLGAGTAVFDVSAYPPGQGPSVPGSTPDVGNSEVERPPILVTVFYHEGIHDVAITPTGDAYYWSETEDYSAKVKEGPAAGWMVSYNGHVHWETDMDGHHVTTSDIYWSDIDPMDNPPPVPNSRPDAIYGGWVSDYYSAFNYVYEYPDRSAQTYKQSSNTRQELRTGGRSGIARQNLFSFYVTGVAYGRPIEIDWRLNGTPSETINPESMKLLGKTVGNDNYLFTVLPDNAPLDVTVTAPGKHYNISVSATKHKLRILANGADTSAEYPPKTPAFIVGQKVPFEGQWDPPPPAVATTTYQWKFNGKYFNEDNPRPGDTSHDYVRNLSHLTEATPQNWWVSGNFDPAASYPVQLDERLTFNNGQSAWVQAFGGIQMYRPKAKVSPVTTRPTVFQGVLLIFSDVPVGDGITFRNTLTIPQGFSGDAKWVQVLNNISVTFQDATQTYTRIQNGPPPYGDYPIPYAAHLDSDPTIPVDSPYEQLYDCFQRCTVSEAFKMWMMFEPPGGVWVPLRAVEWSWSASAVNGAGGWVLDGPGTNTPNPPDHDEQNYAVWNSNVRSKHYNPPRPCGPPD